MKKRAFIVLLIVLLPCFAYSIDFGGMLNKLNEVANSTKVPGSKVSNQTEKTTKNMNNEHIIFTKTEEFTIINKPYKDLSSEIIMPYKPFEWGDTYYDIQRKICAYSGPNWATHSGPKCTTYSGANWATDSGSK